MVVWDQGLTASDPQPYDCNPKSSPLSLGDDTIYNFHSFCNFRIWVHGAANGSGPSHCVDPNPNANGELGIYVPSSETEFAQVQVTEIQAPCAAGSMPYSV